jgi:hypothetical protein
MFLVDEDISTLNQTYSFAIMRAPSNVVEGTTQTSFKEKQGVLCGGDVPIKGWRER